MQLRAVRVPLRGAMLHPRAIGRNKSPETFPFLLREQLFCSPVGGRFPRPTSYETDGASFRISSENADLDAKPGVREHSVAKYAAAYVTLFQSAIPNAWEAASVPFSANFAGEEQS